MIYLLMLTNFDGTVIRSWLKDAAGFVVPDQVDEPDSIIYNPSLEYRQSRMSLSSKLDLEAKTILPILNTNKLIPCDVGLQLRFNCARQNFAIMASKSDAEIYKLFISRCELRINKVELSSTAQLIFERQLTRGINISATDFNIVSISLNAGINEFTSSAYTPPGIMRRCYAAMVSEERMNGAPQLNGLVYKPEGLRTISLMINENVHTIKSNFLDEHNREIGEIYYALLKYIF